MLCHDLKNLRLLDLANMLEIPRQLPAEPESLMDLPWGAEALAELGAVDQFTRERLERSVESLFCAAEHAKGPKHGG